MENRNEKIRILENYLRINIQKYTSIINKQKREKNHQEISQISFRIEGR